MEMLVAAGKPAPQRAFVTTLEAARSNNPGAGTGADVYRRIFETHP